MEIAQSGVQFWSEIKLVILNRPPASRSCDFVITLLISDQIALHSVQLPLLIHRLGELPTGDKSIANLKLACSLDLIIIVLFT